MYLVIRLAMKGVLFHLKCVVYLSGFTILKTFSSKKMAKQLAMSFSGTFLSLIYMLRGISSLPISFETLTADQSDIELPGTIPFRTKFLR